MGVLLPNYHKNYWMGLNTTIWPLFYWVDPLVPQTDSPGAYNNWATGEPNNMNAPEFCGGADLTRTRMGAAAWADLNCANGNVYICKKSGARPRLLPARHSAPSAALPMQQCRTALWQPPGLPFRHRC
jgi:hypothetical protein